MGTKIDTVTARNKLEGRREPYWHKMSRGCSLGYRKMSTEHNGTWQVRYRNNDGTHITKTLGKFEQYPPNQRFDLAMNAAREWVSQFGCGVVPSAITVIEACLAYVEKIRSAKGDNAAEDLAYRYRRWVLNDPIHKIQLTKATREDFQNFHSRLTTAPVKVGKSGITRPRSKDTVNRDVAAVRAALNQAMKDGKTATDFAWRTSLASFKNVTRRRDLYLDRGQRMQLIENSPPDLGRFLRGLSILPLRPGAAAALSVKDYDATLGVIKIGKDKAGADRKFKVPREIAALLLTSIAGRPATEPLFVRDNGQRWNKDAWKDPLKVAAAASGLPLETIAMSLRHSVITDLVHGGLDLLTVAQISGTSVAMIEKHYGHLRGDVAAAALAKLV